MEGEYDCAVCQREKVKLQILGPLANRYVYRCRTCGSYELPQILISEVSTLTKDREKSAVLSHAIRKMQRPSEEPPIITEQIFATIMSRDLPSPQEQAQNLILWLGDTTKPGDHNQINIGEAYSIIGTLSPDGFAFIARSLDETGFLETSARQDGWDIDLSLKGWERYAELKKGHVTSRKGFMAMKFGDSSVDSVFNAFKSATYAAGFSLVRLDSPPAAGLIDNRLRVEIQTSRFLVVDLTDDNSGAYWEGGFAEGLGKPVFYSCNKAFFNKSKTHFDANHSYTVLWDLQKLDTAAEELKLAIRATLPDEAKMTDG